MGFECDEWCHLMRDGGWHLSRHDEEVDLISLAK